MKRQTSRLIERPGLRNVITGPTKLCRLDPKHQTLEYCGYSVAELVEHSSLEEVSWLLLCGELPTRRERTDFTTMLRNFVVGSEQFAEAFRGMSVTLQQHAAGLQPMHGLRTLVSLYGANDMAERPATTAEERITKLLAGMPFMVAALHTPQHPYLAFVDAQRLLKESAAYSTARAFLTMLRGTHPTDEEVALLDASLILYAEHEFNVGTHTLHAITSSNADVYSALCGALGALSGNLHGGANEGAYDLLHAIGTWERAEDVISGIMRSGETIPGFGHAVYKSGDPRCAILKPRVRALAARLGKEELFVLAEHVEQVMLRVKKGRKIYPNIDFWVAVLYELLGIPKSLFTPLFALGRNAGWCAHYLEYVELNRTGGRLNLMRPRGRYVGSEPRPYLPPNDKSQEVTANGAQTI